MPKGGFSLSPHSSPSIPQGTRGEEQTGDSVLSPLFLGMGDPRRLLRLRGLPARVGVRMGVGMGARLGGWPVLALHIDTQPLVTRLLAACLAAAVQNLLHQLVHSGHLLVARALQGYLGGDGGKERRGEMFPKA